MMRRLQRSLKRVRRRISATDFRGFNLIRSYSSRPYSSRGSPMGQTFVPDTDDDDAFQPATPDEAPTDDNRRLSITTGPCVFCRLQQPIRDLDIHELTCRQNPHRIQRSGATPNTTRRTRAVSDYVSTLPSAPPRTRSPSPTEGFPIPPELMCPITHGIFTEPVVASDGNTYERKAILQWLRTNRTSPMTRESLSSNQLVSNRLVKNMVDEFRTKCQRKKALYKYNLDVDVKKIEQIPFIKTDTKSIYRAEWIKHHPTSINPSIVLVQLIGERADKIAQLSCRVEPHPNILRVSGRVDHNDPSILLVQEYSFTQTLSQLMGNTDQKLPIKIYDIILSQIASALQHFTTIDIIYGNIIADNILILHLDEIPENTLIKLDHIGCIENDIHIDKKPSDASSNDPYSEKAAVYAFGKLAQQMYSLVLETKDEVLLERQALYQRCLSADPNDRFTLNELTKTLNTLIHEGK